MQYANERPSIPDSVVREVWERDSRVDAEGKRYIDLEDNDGNPVRVYWEKGESRQGKWDMGHERRYEYWKLRDAYLSHKMSMEDFLAAYKNVGNYKAELPSVNRSRVNESRGGVWPGLPDYAGGK